jgi:DNA-binding NarL/FixJ family response regulator
VRCGQYIPPPELKHRSEVKEAARLLETAADVDLVLTDVRLPDGNWCDVLRLVYERRIAAEVRVLGQDGRTVLRLEVQRSGANSIQCLQSAVSAAHGAGAVAAVA